MQGDMQTFCDNISMSDIDWKDWMMRAGLTAGVAAVSSYLLTADGGGQVDLFGVRLPGSAIIGASAGVGSLSADLAHKYIFPLVPHNERFDKLESVALSAGASGLGCYAGSALIGGNPKLFHALAIGGCSFVASDYAYGMIKPVQLM